MISYLTDFSAAFYSTVILCCHSCCSILISMVGYSFSAHYSSKAGFPSIFSPGSLLFSMHIISLRDIIHSSDSNNQVYPADPAQMSLLNLHLYLLLIEYTHMGVHQFLKLKLSESELKNIPNWERSMSSQSVYYQPAYLTYMQSTSWEMLGWMQHKLESRLPGEISITSEMQLTPLLWQKVNRN